MSKTVIGIFDSASDAQEAVSKLTSAGLSREQVDIANRASSSDTTSSERYNDDHDTSFGDSISNFFGNLFGDDDDDAKKYSEVAKHGYTVTVHASSLEQAEQAAEILDDSGAIDVDDRAAQYFSGNSSTPDRSYSDRDTTEYSDTNITDRDSDITNRSIPVIEENLEVGKREVQSGGARLHSRIVEKPVEESIRLRSEHVNVERNPVDRPATSADFDTFKEGSIEVTERREVPVVNKQARVVEEVSLNKEVEENEETIRDTVRKTEVDVEKLSDEEYRRRNSTSYNNNLDNDDDRL